MFWLCPQELCLEMWWLFLWCWTHYKPSNPIIDKVLTRLCSSCRVGRGGGTCLALKSSQGAEKRRWSGGESVTGQLSNDRHHKIKWRLWYSFQSRQKLKLFKLLRISIFQVEGQIVVECRKIFASNWPTIVIQISKKWSAEKIIFSGYLSAWYECLVKGISYLTVISLLLYFILYLSQSFNKITLPCC